jgi:hypothetical protein
MSTYTTLASSVLKLDFGNMRRKLTRENHAVGEMIRTKKSSSPWAPPTDPTAKNTTINHNSRLALCLAVAVIWAVGARSNFLLVEIHISSDTLFSRFWVSKMQFLPLIGTQNEFLNLPFARPEYLGVV